MLRLTVVAAVPLLLSLVVGSQNLSFSDASAQDDLTARVEDLETRVAALEARVQVVPSDAAVPGSAVTITDSSIVITGAGHEVSDPFTLGEGNYLVQVVYQAEGGYHGLDIKTAPGSGGFINYASLFSGPGPYSGEQLVEVYDAGEFVLVADGEGEFTVTIELP